MGAGLDQLQAFLSRVPVAEVTLLVAVVVAVLFFYGFWIGPKWRRDSRSLEHQRARSGRWESARTVPHDLVVHEPDGRRLLLGHLGRKLVANPPQKSVMVLAPTGSGKTARIVVPGVLRHLGPTVVTSVKADVLHLTYQQRSSTGPVLVFDPTGVSGYPSARWSPLAGISSYGDAARNARWLCDSARSSGGVEDQSFWDTLGRRMLTPMLFAAARHGYDMAEVAHWVLTEDEDTVSALLEELGDRDAEDAWQGHIRTHEKTKSSIYGTAWTVMEAWSHPDVRSAVDTFTGEGPVLDIDQILDQRGTLYVVAPEDDQELFRPIFETLMNAVVREVARRSHLNAGIGLTEPLLLALDEAANIAPLRKLDKIASVGAAQGILLLSIWQDEGQIIDIYGRDKARIVKGNHTAHIFMPGIKDIDTLQNLSGMIGETTVERTSASYDADGRRSTSLSSAEVTVQPAEWLREMAANQCIAIVSSVKPMRLRIEAWFESDELRALMDPEITARFDRQYATHQNRARVGAAQR